MPTTLSMQLVLCGMCSTTSSYRGVPNEQRSRSISGNSATRLPNRRHGNIIIHRMVTYGTTSENRNQAITHSDLILYQNRVVIPSSL